MESVGGISLVFLNSWTLSLNLCIQSEAKMKYEAKFVFLYEIKQQMLRLHHLL